MSGLCNSISGSLTEAVCLFRVRARSPLHGFVMLFLWFGVLETCKSFDVICIPGAPTVEFPCGIDEASKAEANGLARCCAHAERLLESCPQFPAKVYNLHHIRHHAISALFKQQKCQEEREERVIACSCCMPPSQPESKEDTTST